MNIKEMIKAVFTDPIETQRQLNAATEDIVRKDAEIHELRDECCSYGEKYYKRKKAHETLEGEVEELRKRVRVQNEADLFLVSSQIQNRILRGEPVSQEDGMVKAQQTFVERAQMAAMKPGGVYTLK